MTLRFSTAATASLLLTLALAPAATHALPGGPGGGPGGPRDFGNLIPTADFDGQTLDDALVDDLVAQEGDTLVNWGACEDEAGELIHDCVNIVTGTTEAFTVRSLLAVECTAGPACYAGYAPESRIDASLQQVDADDFIYAQADDDSLNLTMDSELYLGVYNLVPGAGGPTRVYGFWPAGSIYSEVEIGRTSSTATWRVYDHEGDELGELGGAVGPMSLSSNPDCAEKAAVLGSGVEAGLSVGGTVLQIAVTALAAFWSTPIGGAVGGAAGLAAAGPAGATAGAVAGGAGALMGSVTLGQVVGDAVRANAEPLGEFAAALRDAACEDLEEPGGPEGETPDDLDDPDYDDSDDDFWGEQECEFGLVTEEGEFLSLDPETGNIMTCTANYTYDCAGVADSSGTCICDLLMVSDPVCTYGYSEPPQDQDLSGGLPL
jgi:hypothetical protein